jgi:hypothetical protein
MCTCCPMSTFFRKRTFFPETAREAAIKDIQPYMSMAESRFNFPSHPSPTADLICYVRSSTFYWNQPSLNLELAAPPRLCLFTAGTAHSFPIFLFGGCFLAPFPILSGACCRHSPIFPYFLSDGCFLAPFPILSGACCRHSPTFSYFV